MRPPIVLALTPHLAAWGKLQIDNSLGGGGHQRCTRWASTSCGRSACSTRGSPIMGGGAILGGLVLGAIAAFVIDRDSSRKAAASRSAGAALTFFGFMHGEAIGIAESPAVAASYLCVAVSLLAARSSGRWPRRSRR